MATFLDTGLLDAFSIIFMFILLFMIGWGILEKSNFFGDGKKGLNAWIALFIAILGVASAPTRIFLTIVTPWFLALAVVFFMIVLVSSIFGNFDWKAIVSSKEDGGLRTIMIVAFAAIFLAGLAFTFGQPLLESGQGRAADPVPVINENGDVSVGSGVPTSGTLGSGGTGSGDFQANLVNTLIHPKVLGLGLIFALSAFIVLFLTKTE